MDMDISGHFFVLEASTKSRNGFRIELARDKSTLLEERETKKVLMAK